MKLKRDEFKAMLKECILELVQEGKIFQNAQPSNQGNLNEVSQGSRQDYDIPNKNLTESVRIATHMVSKGDPKKKALYESIFNDTARTTLQKQLASEMGGAGLMESSIMPEEREFDQAQLGIFAANQRWAQLAFAGENKKP